MLVWLPLLVLLGMTILLASRVPSWGWRRSLLRAAVITAAYAILMTETLSLVSGVTAIGLASVWAVLFVAVAAGLVVTARGTGLRSLPRLALPARWSDRLLLLAVIVIALTTAIIAWYAPPNTWDSLNYHMARVAHWTQQHSIRHFATGTEVQNGLSPGAEILVLQTYVLGNGDRWVNFIEWLAMVISVVGATLVARQLGARPSGEVLAGVFVATLPMGIAQASSTMTDYVVAVWMMCTATETVLLLIDGPSAGNTLFLSLSAGLALTAKPTAFVYLLPFAVLSGITLLRHCQPRSALRSALIVVVAVLALNGGHWARNIMTYGNPLGDQIAVHSNEIHPPAALVSNVLRHAGLQAGTPWEVVNRQLMRGVLKVHQLIGLDVNDPRTTSIGEFTIAQPSREENHAPNWFHAWVYAGIFGLLLIQRKRFSLTTWGYVLATVATFVLFCYVFKWQIFSSRYHLPFFVLFAPAAAVIVSKRAPSWLIRLLGVSFILGCWPWLLRLENRPMLPEAESGVSVLSEPRDRLYFWPGSSGVRDEMAVRILEEGCSTVGIMLTGNGAEYPFWVYLGAPRPGLEIEWIVSGTPSARYEDPGFAPCAVICDFSCPQDWTTIRGLTLAEDAGGLRLFLDPGAVDPR